MDKGTGIIAFLGLVFIVLGITTFTLTDHIYAERAVFPSAVVNVADNVGIEMHVSIEDSVSTSDSVSP